MSVDVDRDGRGTVAVSLTVDEELAARAQEAGIDVFAPLAEAAAADTTWSARISDETATIRAPFDAPSELQQRTAALADDLAAPELDPLDAFTVEVDDERITVGGVARLDLTEAVADLGVAEQAAEAVIADAVDYTVRIEVPGEVLEASAGAQVDGRTVTWTVPVGGEVPVLVVARRPPAVAWWAWAVLAGAVVAAAALAAWWRLRRRRVRTAHRAGVEDAG